MSDIHIFSHILIRKIDNIMAFYDSPYDQLSNDNIVCIIYEIIISSITI